MKGKRHTVEQRIRILRLADGERTVLDVCREHGISEQTFYRWKKDLGLMDVNQMKRLKELEAENTRLREKCLDREWLWTLTEARVAIEDWRREYSRIRPHGSLKIRSPVQFTEECDPQRQPESLDVPTLHERYSMLNPALGLT